MVDVVVPSTDLIDALTDMWVDLAREQRAHGSHILADENRTRVRESVARHVVTGGVLVARTAEGDDDSRDANTAVSNGRHDLVGFVQFQPETGEFEQDTDRGLVQYLYVRPEHRRRGVGSALLERAEASLFADGVDAVALEVLANNEDARRFYRRHGYEPRRVELETQSDTHTKDR